jgi:hypothetical protein
VNSFDRAERNTESVKARLGRPERAPRCRTVRCKPEASAATAGGLPGEPTALENLDPEAIVLDTLDAHGEMLEELAQIAAMSSHDGARLGAIRAQADVHAARLGLLQAVGALPADLAHLRVEIDVRRTAGTILEIFNRRGVPEEVQAEIVHALNPA